MPLPPKDLQQTPALPANDKPQIGNKSKIHSALSSEFKMTEIMDNEHNITIHPHWPSRRQKSAAAMKTKVFRIGVPLLIIASFVLCVAIVEARATGNDHRWMTILEFFLNCFFALELFVRIDALRENFFVPWNILDVVVICVDLLFSVLELTIGRRKGPSATVLRLFRIIRTARISRVLVEFRELYLLVHGFISAMKSLFWGSCLILVVLIVWSILAVEFLHPLNVELYNEGVHEGCERCGRAFSTIPQATLTFVQTIVTGDSWGLLAIPIIERSPWTTIIFFGVVGSVQLGLMNLILAVIVDRATEARLEDNYFQHLSKEESFASYKEQMSKVVMSLTKTIVAISRRKRFLRVLRPLWNSQIC
jgi:hypothetical protein